MIFRILKLKSSLLTMALILASHSLRADVEWVKGFNDKATLVFPDKIVMTDGEVDFDQLISGEAKAPRYLLSWSLDRVKDHRTLFSNSELMASLLENGAQVTNSIFDQYTGKILTKIHYPELSRSYFENIDENFSRHVNFSIEEDIGLKNTLLYIYQGKWSTIHIELLFLNSAKTKVEKYSVLNPSFEKFILLALDKKYGNNENYQYERKTKRYVFAYSRQVEGAAPGEILFEYSFLIPKGMGLFSADGQLKVNLKEGHLTVSILSSEGRNEEGFKEEE
ncbi:MAG: hypothetical protein KA116_12355 [Proteobacteria bacterium]|nr:hypothetical protein [Pseudomonadota bacterium]